VTLLLQDSAGYVWLVTADYLTGRIVTIRGSIGVSPAVFMNDLGLTTSWQLSITTGGILQTTPVSFAGSYPTVFSLSTAYNLVITSAGLLESIPAPPTPITASPITRTGTPSSGQIVPLTSSPNQTFATTLQVDGKSLTLNLNVYWSEMAGYWLMSISDSAGNLLLDSLPLITGWYPAGNILGQYAYLAIGSAYILNEGSSNSDYPGRNDLGTSWVLLWDDTAVVEEVAA
jgi:hypothetical protein